MCRQLFPRSGKLHWGDRTTFTPKYIRGHRTCQINSMKIQTFNITYRIPNILDLTASVTQKSSDMPNSTQTQTSKMAGPFGDTDTYHKELDTRRLQKTRRKGAKRRRERLEWCSDWFVHLQDPERQKYTWEWYERQEGSKRWIANDEK